MAQTQDERAVRGDARGTRSRESLRRPPRPRRGPRRPPGRAAQAGRSPQGSADAAARGANPVARVAVDIPLAHLDRPFDYLVPERLAAQARPGVRVRVRFAGQLTDGFVLERVAESEHQGRLAWLDRVISPEVVLTDEIAGLARAVADRYAGTLADVLRLAIPPRHAATEKPRARGRRMTRPAVRAAPARPAPGPWARYPAGEAFLSALADGRPARAGWTALPGQTWPEEIALAAATAASAGRGTLIVVPDARDLARVDEALARALAGRRAPGGRAPGGGSAPRPARHVTLSADLGPAERYRRWLAVSRGEVTVTAGTRAAMFAPVAQPRPRRAVGRGR